MLRNKILERDKYKCVHCGDKATQVHHIFYRGFYKERMEDLESLCGNCHLTLHDLN